MDNYEQIILSSYRLGALEVLKLLKPKDDEMSQREAYAEFGKAFVDDAVKNARISVIRKGRGKNSKKIYSRAELTKIVSERDVLRSIIRIETQRPKQLEGRNK